MVTKDQATAARHGDEFHFVGYGRKGGKVHKFSCVRTIGPRGGVKDEVLAYRINGTVKTWKREPARFYMPLKRGMYDSTSIVEWNAEEWHRAEDCPLNK